MPRQLALATAHIENRGEALDQQSAGDPLMDVGSEAVSALDRSRRAKATGIPVVVTRDVLGDGGRACGYRSLVDSNEPSDPTAASLVSRGA